MAKKGIVPGALISVDVPKNVVADMRKHFPESSSDSIGLRNWCFKVALPDVINCDEEGIALFDGYMGQEDDYEEVRCRVISNLPQTGTCVYMGDASPTELKVQTEKIARNKLILNPGISSSIDDLIVVPYPYLGFHRMPLLLASGTVFVPVETHLKLKIESMRREIEAGAKELREYQKKSDQILVDEKEIGLLETEISDLQKEKEQLKMEIEKIEREEQEKPPDETSENPNDDVPESEKVDTIDILLNM
jgi:hypothetical protein